MSELPQKSKFHVMEYSPMVVLIERCDTLCETNEGHGYTFSEAKEDVVDFYKEEMEHYNTKLGLAKNSFEYWSNISLEEWEKHTPSINDYE